MITKISITKGMIREPMNHTRDSLNAKIRIWMLKTRPMIKPIMRWTPKFGPGAKLRLWWTGAAKKPNQNH